MTNNRELQVTLLYACDCPREREAPIPRSVFNKKGCMDFQVPVTPSRDALARVGTISCSIILSRSPRQKQKNAHHGKSASSGQGTIARCLGWHFFVYLAAFFGFVAAFLFFVAAVFFFVAAFSFSLAAFFFSLAAFSFSQAAFFSL